MCYIQLSLLGVAAYIKVGNTLTDPMSSSDALENYWYTPMYFSDVWAMRRMFHRLDDRLREKPMLKKRPLAYRLLVQLEEEDCRCSLVDFYSNVAKKAGFTRDDGELFNCAKIRTTEAVRDALYTYYKKLGTSDLEIALLLAQQGPATDLDRHGYAAEIEDGFIMEGTPNGH